jgi:hypothetical protein
LRGVELGGRSKLTRQPLLLNALQGAIEMIGAADDRLAFRRKAGDDEGQNVSYGSLADMSGYEKKASALSLKADILRGG